MRHRHGAPWDAPPPGDLFDVAGEPSDAVSVRAELSAACEALSTKRRPDAAPLLADRLAKAEETLGVDDPDVLSARVALAAAFREAGSPELAVPLYERTVACRTRTLGRRHPDTLTAWGDLSAAYHAAGNPRWSVNAHFRRQALAAEEPRPPREHIPGTWPTCRCGSPAVGICQLCHECVCHSHSKLESDVRVCLGDAFLRAAEARIDAAAAERRRTRRNWDALKLPSDPFERLVRLSSVSEPYVSADQLSTERERLRAALGGTVGVLVRCYEELQNAVPAETRAAGPLSPSRIHGLVIGISGESAYLLLSNGSVARYAVDRRYGFEILSPPPEHVAIEAIRDARSRTTMRWAE